MVKTKGEMSPQEIDQFLACARVGRLGLVLDDCAYVVPLGYVYVDGKICFHTCNAGQKMQVLRKNPNVCFEVDETLSDGSMYKSIILFGTIEIIDDPQEIIPYFQLLINKYRVPEKFEDYMNKPGRDRDKELAATSIIVITPTEISGRKFSQIHQQ